MTHAAISNVHAAALPRDDFVAHRERLLDEALAQSFPASDPPSMIAELDRTACLDNAGGSSILSSMTERAQIRRPQLHPGSSTARF